MPLATTITNANRLRYTGEPGQFCLIVDAEAQRLNVKLGDATSIEQMVLIYHALNGASQVLEHELTQQLGTETVAFIKAEVAQLPPLTGQMH